MMAKRPLAEEALEASASKRRHISADRRTTRPRWHRREKAGTEDAGDDLFDDEGCDDDDSIHHSGDDGDYEDANVQDDDDDGDGVDDDDGDDDDDSYHDGSMETPASSTNNIDSPLTAATTPRTKFPSDYKTLACTWPGCAKTFNRPARLRDHMNSHTNSRPHKCPHDGCGKDYIEDKHLQQHIKSVHRNERRYACPRPGCGKSFVTGTRLKRHQAVHEGADRFRCADCGQSFRKRETLGKHVRKEHLGQAAYPCGEPGCARGFDTKPALQRHREREHGEPRFWCAECGPATTEDTANSSNSKGTPASLSGRVGFTTHAALQQHMRLEHQNCLFCDFKSRSLWEFQTHIDIHHSGKSLEDRKTVACPRPGCGKKFTKRSNLNVHIRTAHEGVRFVCGQVALAGPGFEGWSNDLGCGDKFSTKVRLEDHVRFKHLGHERPRMSARVGASRPSAENVIDELVGINIARRQAIRCPSCGQGFSRYFDLNLHIAKVHDHAGEHVEGDGDHDLNAEFAPENIFFPEEGSGDHAGLHVPLADGLDPSLHSQVDLNHQAMDHQALHQASLQDASCQQPIPFHEQITSIPQQTPNRDQPLPHQQLPHQEPFPPDQSHFPHQEHTSPNQSPFPQEHIPSSPEDPSPNPTWTQAALLHEHDLFATARFEYDTPTAGDDDDDDDKSPFDHPFHQPQSSHPDSSHHHSSHDKHDSHDWLATCDADIMALAHNDPSIDYTVDPTLSIVAPF